MVTVATGSVGKTRGSGRTAGRPGVVCGLLQAQGVVGAPVEHDYGPADRGGPRGVVEQRYDRAREDRRKRAEPGPAGEQPTGRVGALGLLHVGEPPSLSVTGWPLIASLSWLASAPAETGRAMGLASDAAPP